MRLADNDRKALKKSLGRLEGRGLVGRARKRISNLRPLAKKPGALARFLEVRE